MKYFGFLPKSKVINDLLGSVFEEDLKKYK